MTCDDARDLLGTAGDPLPPELARHLESCAACRAAAEDLRAVAPHLARLPRSVAPPRAVWEGIERRIARPAPSRWGRRWLPLAAALVLALGGGWLAFSRLRPSAGPALLPERVAVRQSTYLEALADLEPLAHSAALPAVVAAAFRSDLDAIEVAIREVAAALARTPDNELLQDLHLRWLRRKIELLRRAAYHAEG
jgi:hypothetical protein